MSINVNAIKVGDWVSVQHEFVESVIFTGQVKVIFSIGDFHTIAVETLLDAIVTVTTDVYKPIGHKKES